MKNQLSKHVLIIATMIWAFIFCCSSCNRKDEMSLTIIQGIYGTAIERYGNWMPIEDPDPTTRGERPIVTEVYVYECTKRSDFDEVPKGTHFPIDGMPKPLVAKTRSEKNGFYQVTLKEGKYSVFILDEDKLYANGFDEEGNICPVIITKDSIVKLDLVLDHAVY